MDRVSNKLRETNKDFSNVNRDKTYSSILMLAMTSQAKRNPKSKKLMGIKKVIRSKYPQMTTREVERVQDNISDWLSTHKHEPMFDTFREKLPNIFHGTPDPVDMGMDLPFDVAPANPIIEEPAYEEDQTIVFVRQLRDMGVKSFKDDHVEVQF